jgi:hypothetical protein
MAVSSLLTTIAGIFATLDYAGRIPENVKNAIASGNYGQQEYDQTIKNAVINTLVDKIARQDIYAFEFNNFDGSQYEKGYLAYGGIV